MSPRAVSQVSEPQAAAALARRSQLTLGALLVDIGRLSSPDAERIHAQQKATGQLFGEAGIDMGLLNTQDVHVALSLQFGHIALPPDAALSSELVAAWEPDNPAVEHLRSLRSELMLRWFENDARHAALAVISPGRGEGRSYITANLATLFSQLGRRTLVIDADLRNPRQSRLFGLARRAGLSGVLSGRLGIEAVVDIPGLPNLSLLPAGIAPPNPQELLARNGFSQLLSALRSSFEVILVDTPAYTGCADAGIVSARAGAALVVACRDTGSLPGIAALTDSLRKFGVTAVGAVLNSARRA